MLPLTHSQSLWRFRVLGFRSPNTIVRNPVPPQSNRLCKGQDLLTLRGSLAAQSSAARIRG
jgi:hypothetical protein